MTDVTDGPSLEVEHLAIEVARMGDDFPNYASWPIELPAGHWRAILAALSQPPAVRQEVKELPSEADAYLQALMDYSGGFYGACREAGLPAKDCVDAMAHIERAARNLHRLASLPPSAPQAVGGEELHQRTANLIEDFAAALKAKLRGAEQKYGYADGWARDDWEYECVRNLFDHLLKGDPRDVAAYAAFCWAHGWKTTPPAEALSTTPARPKLDREKLAATAREVIDGAYLRSAGPTEFVLTATNLDLKLADAIIAGMGETDV